jgi:cobalt-zinc-cadmium efflux system outer membrane protein
MTRLQQRWLQCTPLACAALPMLLSACALQSYRPAKVDTEAAAAAYLGRTTSDPKLKAYMVSHGHPESQWPVQRWGIDELTLLAFYYHPDLQVARARASEAQAQAQPGLQRLPWAVKPAIAHHSQQQGYSDSPWSLGFELEIPLATGSRQQALVERAEYLAQVAELDVGSTAWRVRSRVRASLVELEAAQDSVALLERDVETRRALLALLERRLQAGYIASTEVAAARVRLYEVEGELASARTVAARARGELAAALGLPIDALDGTRLDFSQIEALPDPISERAARSEALQNRVDMRQRLLEFSAADAEVKLEIARQYPTVSLRPGYLWDQGDNVWLLAVDLFLPAVLGNAPGIQVAEARRETAAQVALQDQAGIIAETDTALTAYRQSVMGARAAREASVVQLTRSSQLQKQFDAGYSDRTETTQARLEAVTVERNALRTRVEAQRALGRLEDALQRPLAGGPFPVYSPPASAQK